MNNINDQDAMLQNMIRDGETSEFSAYEIPDIAQSLFSMYNDLPPYLISEREDPLLSTSLHTPERPDSSLRQEEEEIKTEVTSSAGSPLMLSEEFRNHLNLFDNDEPAITPNNSILASPFLVISLTPWAGVLDFKASIPQPKYEGVKSKWCFSNVSNKLFVAKNVAFPVSVSMNRYPPGASLVVCPVFTDTSYRMLPVNRCPNCMLSDTNPCLKDHVLRIECGSEVTSDYFEQEDRHKVSIPLRGPAPGDSNTNILLKVACNTSCVGGPNRQLFSAVLSIVLGNKEIGRQVIDIKCCEGPIRDRAKEDQKLLALNQEREAPDEAGTRIAIELPAPQSPKKSKRKRDVGSEKRVMKKERGGKCVAKRKGGARVDSLETETLRIPKKYLKKVKLFVEDLYVKDEIERRNLKFETIYSTSESD